MNKEDILQSVKSQMTEKRFIHTLGVMETARKLAKKYGADEEKAEIAALIHDVAKCWPVKEQSAYITEHQLDVNILHYDKELWHAEVGAHYAFAEYGIDDEDMRYAIRYHTSGRMGMSLLEKIIWVADYIEPNRSFDGVEKARKLAKTSLEEAILYGLNNTIIFLIAKGKVIYPTTLDARNDILLQLN